jgi:hypothetical protein
MGREGQDKEKPRSVNYGAWAGLAGIIAMSFGHCEQQCIQAKRHRTGLSWSVRWLLELVHEQFADR